MLACYWVGNSLTILGVRYPFYFILFFRSFRESMHAAQSFSDLLCAFAQRPFIQSMGQTGHANCECEFEKAQIYLHSTSIALLWMRFFFYLYSVPIRFHVMSLQGSHTNSTQTILKSPSHTAPWIAIMKLYLSLFIARRTSEFASTAVARQWQTKSAAIHVSDRMRHIFQFVCVRGSQP